MYARRIIVIAAALLTSAASLTTPAWAYIDGPPTLCKIYQSRSTVTGTYATAETSSQTCLYDFATERPVLYQTITFKGNESWDSDFMFSSCTVGYTARDSRGYTISSGSTTIPVLYMECQKKTIACGTPTPWTCRTAGRRWQSAAW